MNDLNPSTEAAPASVHSMQTLDQMPDMAAVALKAFTTMTRRPGRNPAIPALNVGLPATAVDVVALRKYREVCGFREYGYLPMTFPQVMAWPLQLHLLVQPEFPLPLLGLVHLRNQIRQYRPMSADNVYSVHVGLGECRTGSKGLEFDLVTRYFDPAGRPVWESVATTLHREKGGSGGARRSALEDVSIPMEQTSFDVPADIGRRYAGVSGDWNPIHLYAFSARLFGFPRAVAHGMWSLAQSCARLEEKLAAPPRELFAQFKQPLFLPGRVTLSHSGNTESIEFRLTGHDGGATHVVGMLR